jgi:hypothetical protein
MLHICDVPMHFSTYINNSKTILLLLLLSYTMSGRPIMDITKETPFVVSGVSKLISPVG